MALNNPSPEQLRMALQEGLNRLGVPSEVSFEQIPQTSLNRFVAISGSFNQMPYSDRQSLVWRITDGLLAPAIQLQLISSIVTLGTAEINGAGTNGSH